MSGVIASSTDDLSWSHLSAYTAPYVTIGNFVLNVMPLAETDTAAAEAEVLKRLEELRAQFDQLRRSIGQQVSDERLVVRTGAVLGLKESLDEYSSTRDRELLIGVQLRSAEEKQVIMRLLELSDTPLAYYHIYNTLLCMLVALRVACFVLLKLARPALFGEVCRELNDALRFKVRGIEVAREIGSNRVSRVIEERFVFDEVGPVIATTFTIKVDGKTVYSDEFAGIREVPRRDIAVVRSQARKVRDELAEQQATLASEDLRRYYATAEATTPLVCV